MVAGTLPTHVQVVHTTPALHTRYADLHITSSLSVPSLCREEAVFQDNEIHLATIQGSESGQPPRQISMSVYLNYLE